MLKNSMVCKRNLELIIPYQLDNIRENGFIETLTLKDLDNNEKNSR